MSHGRLQFYWVRSNVSLWRRLWLPLSVQSLRHVRGLFNVPTNHATLKMQETGPTVYSLYPRRLQCLIICRWRQHILLRYFKTLSVGPVWGSNLRLPAQQTGALPTELARRRLNLPSIHLWGFSDQWKQMQGAREQLCAKPECEVERCRDYLGCY